MGEGMDRVRVSILGATGLVGQWMIKLLANHPFIEIVGLSASPGKVGRKYGDVVHWFIPGDIPEYVKDMALVSTDPADHKAADVVLSALPNDVAWPTESKLANAGLNVVSNASPERMNPRIPLINPEVNWEHLNILRDLKGNWMVKNPNCTAAIISMPLKPIQDLIGTLHIVTLQSVSGAGYLGLSYLAIDGNVIPFIKGEEEKIDIEINKMLGKQLVDHYDPWGKPIYVTATRVPVKYGHTAVIHAILNRNADANQVIERLRRFKSLPQEKELPTAPREPIKVLDRVDAPQPARDLDPMAVSVGRVTIRDNVLRLVVIGDNLVRGAAGITILTIETMKTLGIL
ncbi:aspartate-semialdehyde dehydrogenase [Vulcanisaeta souniana JCM 11219]|uniref:Aspartate-semialdehyde dehydrogenase n=2 Tax=Vulcanisaeta souniana TaxID=164452 RepID=A0A830EEV3_9CREN|nr:aspartate-semialdehyde dehydrogenase [Vulcanisaeta souniana JCM 11219]GGI76047.1 aspartate-semialdehyde dehydrogenase [Vulcanisaeta souniana JCM 11219]